MAVPVQPMPVSTDIQRFWDLLYVLVRRNLKVRYRGSFLGIYWSLLNPMLMTGLYTMIFGREFARYYNNSIVSYMLAAFTGLVVINFFSASTNQALPSLVSNGSLLNKVNLPITVFPISSVAANVFQFVLGSLPLLIVVSLFHFHSVVSLLALIIPLVSLLLTCLGVSLLISALYVFFRDLPYFYELVVFVLWISSPVFYPAKIVPGNLRPLFALNPLTPIIESIRTITLEGQVPSLMMLAGGLLSSVILLGVGWGCFQGLRSQFMDLL